MSWPATSPGVTTAVATCGTAFGVDHIKVIRRVLGDVDNADSTGVGEVVFTFDPDAAGQKAASRAFAEEQRFAAQTFVAVGPEGLDPCDLRLHNGDEAVRRMVAGKKPMFEFMIRRMLAGHDLETVEGRVAALRAAAPVVAEHPGPARCTPATCATWPAGSAWTRARCQGAVSAARGEVDRPVGAARARSIRDARTSRRRRRMPRRLVADAAAIAGRPGHPPGAGRADGDPAASGAVGHDLVQRASQVAMANASLAVVRDAVAASLDASTPAGWLRSHHRRGAGPVLRRWSRSSAWRRFPSSPGVS